MWRRYLLWFAQEHLDFRQVEMEAIVGMLGVEMRVCERGVDHAPYWVVELQDEAAAQRVAARAVCLRSVHELWAHARNVPELHAALRASTQRAGPTRSACQLASSFKIHIDTFCKHYSMEDKIKIIEDFEYLPVAGAVRLRDPELTLVYTEYYGTDPNNVPPRPLHVFFGRRVCEGQRERITRLSLKTRRFLGNTSMDAQLALLMANIARVQPGDVVMDPFVGSGSLLVAAAHFGGYVWGADIDLVMLHGRTRPTRVNQKRRGADEGVLDVMRQYGLASRFLDVVASDATQPPWHTRLRPTAIITDPPYGVREAGERVQQLRAGAAPSTVRCSVARLYAELLAWAAQRLPPAGRLVTFYPVVRTEYSTERLPAHPALALVGNCEQVLSRLASRRLLVYERTTTPVSALTTALQPEPAQEFRAAYLRGLRMNHE